MLVLAGAWRGRYVIITAGTQVPQQQLGKWSQEEEEGGGDEDI